MRVILRGIVGILALVLSAGTATAAVSFKAGVYQSPASTGNHAVTGVGFQPKALIVWADAASLDTFVDHGHVKIGMTDGTRQYAGGYTSVDNLGTTQGQSVYEDSYLIYYQAQSGAIPSVQVRAAFTSFDSDGFTLNWDTATAQIYVHYLAFGGSDLSATVNHFSLLTTDTTTKAVSGLGFQPSAVIFAPTRANGDLVGTGANGVAAKPALGWTDGTREGAFVTFSADAAATADTKSYQRTDRCVLMVDDAGAAEYELSIASFDSDGFTLTVDDATSTNVRIPFLALSGVEAYAGSLTQPTSTGSQAVTGVGFQPTGLLTASVQKTASTAIVDHANVWVGFSDGTAEVGGYFGDADAVDPTRSVNRAVSDKVAFAATPAATAASSTTDAAADLTSFDSGGFTLQWTTADATGREFLFLALAANVGTTRIHPLMLGRFERN